MPKNEENGHLIVKNHDQYFIGSDNGIFSLILIKPDGIWNINRNPEINDSFPTKKDIFVPIACHLARGGLPAVVAKEVNEIKTKQLLDQLLI